MTPGAFQVMKEVQSALSTAAADDSKLVLLSAVGSVFCCGLDFIYFIRRLTDDRKRESTKMAEAIRYAHLVRRERRRDPDPVGRVWTGLRAGRASPPLRLAGSRVSWSDLLSLLWATCLEQMTHVKVGWSPAHARWGALRGQSAG